jgi:hypothetical protein
MFFLLFTSIYTSADYVFHARKITRDTVWTMAYNFLNSKLFFIFSQLCRMVAMNSFKFCLE